MACEHTDENAVKDIETLMSELDILKARNTDLESRNTELEAENTSQKERIERLVATAIAFITVEGFKEYIKYEEGKEEWYDDKDIYCAIEKVCGEGYDKSEYYAAVHDLLCERRQEKVLEDLTCDQLKQRLRAINKPVGGRKAELIQRIRRHDEDEDEEDEEEEVRCVCPDCHAEGKCVVSKRRAKELEKQELMEECCPFGDKCTYDSDPKSDDDDEESDEN